LGAPMGMSGSTRVLVFDDDLPMMVSCSRVERVVARRWVRCRVASDEQSAQTSADPRTREAGACGGSAVAVPDSLSITSTKGRAGQCLYRSVKIVQCIFEEATGNYIQLVRGRRANIRLFQKMRRLAGVRARPRLCRCARPEVERCVDKITFVVIGACAEACFGLSFAYMGKVSTCDTCWIVSQYQNHREPLQAPLNYTFEYID
jgi:hypothetical protein